MSGKQEKQEKQEKQNKQVVHKSLVMEKRLAGAIGAWAVSAGVSFSEAVRMLCSQGLATWPGSPFAAPFGSSQEVLDELHHAERRICDAVRNVLDEVAGDVLYELPRRLAEDIEQLRGSYDGYAYDDDDGAVAFHYNPVSMMYAASDIDFDDDEDEDEADYDYDDDDDDDDEDDERDDLPVRRPVRRPIACPSS